MLLDATILTATLTTLTGQNLVTFKVGEQEIAKIELTDDFVKDLRSGSYDREKMMLFQLICTPHLHNTYLNAIIPFVKDVKSQLADPPLTASLDSWLTQVQQLLDPPTTPQG